MDWVFQWHDIQGRLRRQLERREGVRWGWWCKQCQSYDPSFHIPQSFVFIPFLHQFYSISSNFPLFRLFFVVLLSDNLPRIDHFDVYNIVVIYIPYNTNWLGFAVVCNYLRVLNLSPCVLEGSTWTSGPARPTRPFWHPWVWRHWCEYPHRFAQQICHKDHHCAGEIPTLCCSAVLESYQQRALHTKTHWHKRALFPAERGFFEKGPLPQSRVCVTVMWYIWDILRVNYTQVV